MKTDINLSTKNVEKEVNSQHVSRVDSQTEYSLWRSRKMIEGVFPIFSRNAFFDLSNGRKTQNAGVCAGSAEIAQRALGRYL